jgi:hypothetical protein
VLFGQIDAAGAAAHVKNFALGWEIRCARKVLNQLELRLFFCLITANRIPLVQVLAPQRAVVRADTIKVIADFFLLVVAWHRNMML